MIVVIFYALGSALIWVIELIDAFERGWKLVGEFALQPVTIPLFVFWLVAGAGVIGIVAIVEPWAGARRSRTDNDVLTSGNEFNALCGTLRRHYSHGYGINVFSALFSPEYRIDAFHIYTTLEQLNISTIPVDIEHKQRQEILLQLIDLSGRSDVEAAIAYMSNVNEKVNARANE